MKNLALLIASAILCMNVAHAEYSVFGGFKTSTLTDGSGVVMMGETLGLSKSPDSNGLYIKAQNLKDNDLDVKLQTVDAGYQHSFYTDEHWNAVGKIGVGVGKVKINYDAPSVDMKVVTVPVSFEFAYNITPNLMSYTEVGYEFITIKDTKIKCGSSIDSNICAAINNDLNSFMTNQSIHGITSSFGLRYMF